MKINFGRFLLAAVILLPHIIDANQDFPLPNDLRPVKYQLTIILEPENTRFSYSGLVRITVQCFKKTQKIVLNMKDLLIEEEEVKVRNTSDNLKPNIGVLDHDYDLMKDQYIIIMEKELEENKTYEVSIPFHKYPFADPLDRTAFIRETYQNGPGQRNRQFTVTMFGPTNARKLFPCLDQSNLRAKFRIFLGHEKDVMAFSNMPFLRHEPISDRENWIMDEFEFSVPLSTHHVGFAFVYAQSKRLYVRSSDVIFQIWANQAIMEQMEFASKTAVEIFEFYTKFFNTPYALKKLDIIALPNFDGEDKNKYGLITLGDSFLANPDSSDEAKNQEIQRRLCRVLSHQWIGTQVNMAQWNEYWLLEALAFFAETRCLEKVSNVFDQRVVDIFSHLLKADKEISTLPLLVSKESFDMKRDFENPNRIEKAYQLVSMLNFALGDALFQRGLSEYLEGYKFSSTNLNEVASVFQKVADEAAIFKNNERIADIMNSWFEPTQKEYPLISVVSGEGNFLLKQERFLLLGEQPSTDEVDSYWHFPFSLASKSNLVFENVKITWFHKNFLLIEDKNLKPNEWIIFSGNLNVPCRIRYGMTTWDLLHNALIDRNEFLLIPEMARVRLISDMFALSEAGKLRYAILLSAMKYLEHEESYFPWMVAMNELNKIRLNLYGTNVLRSYEKFVRDILESVFTREHFAKIEEVSHHGLRQKQFKKLIIWSSCDYGVDACVQQCKTFYNKWLTSESPGKFNPIPQAVRSLVYCQAIKHGAEKEWNFLWMQYSKENDQTAVNDILEGLSCSKSPEILGKFLKLSINKYKILPGDSPAVFKNVSSNEVGYQLAKNFFVEHQEEIVRRYSKDDSILVSYFVKLLEVTSKEDVFLQLKDLIDTMKDKLSGWESLLDENLRKSKRNCLWLEINENILSEVLLDQHDLGKPREV